MSLCLPPKLAKILLMPVRRADSAACTFARIEASVTAAFGASVGATGGVVGAADAFGFSKAFNLSGML